MASFEQTKALHLVGSTKDAYYSAVSMYYARQMVNSKWHTSEYEFTFAVVSPDSSWKFPDSLNKEDVDAAQSYNFIEAISHIKDVLQPDVMVPHMFCPEGMTAYRSLFESLLNIPFIGCDPIHMGITTDKALTRAIVKEAGVRIPEGIVISSASDERIDTLSLPLIIKPACEDNSIGLTLARTREQLALGVEEALKVDKKVVVEEFIAPGKEIRVGLVENPDGTLTTLPKYEYFVSSEDPIRTMAHKYTPLDDQGELQVATGNRQCPADISPEVADELDEMAKLAHKALKCRDYSLFDFRVDPDGKTYFLEACSYCSFAPRCVLMSMTDLTELRCPVFFDNMVRAALNRKSLGDCSSTSSISQN